MLFSFVFAHLHIGGWELARICTQAEIRSALEQRRRRSDDVAVDARPVVAREGDAGVLSLLQADLGGGPLVVDVQVAFTIVNRSD